MAKADPYKSQQSYLNWKKTATYQTEGISKQNFQILLHYLDDMELGKDTANKKPLSYIRIKTLRTRMSYLMKQFSKLFKVNNIIDVTEDQALRFFSNMDKGIIKSKLTREPYKSTQDYLKVFKAFWHWHERKLGRQGQRILDITKYISVKKSDKPPFVYLSQKEFRNLVEKAKYEYKVMMWFIYDSGIRFPTEFLSIKVEDITKDDNFTYLDIKDEYAKTFGRKIKLHSSKQLVWNWIEENKLKPQNQLFDINYLSFNTYLKRLSKKVFGVRKTKGRKTIDLLTGYDLRHSSACRYVSTLDTQTMMYRFGWTNMDMIHYYTETIGMRDNSNMEDILTDTTKTELQNQVQLLNDRLNRFTDIWNETMIHQYLVIESLFPDVENYEQLQEIINTKRKEQGLPLLAESIQQRFKELKDHQKTLLGKSK